MSGTLTGRLTTGVLVVMIGLLLLLSTTGLVATASLWAWVPALFVLLGVWALLWSNFRNLVGPVMVVAIAGAFLLRNVGLLSDGAIGTWWPLFVVLLGLLIVVNRSRRRKRYRIEGVDPGDGLSGIAIFGDVDRQVATEKFTGAEIVSVFGDVLYDLRSSGILQRPAIVEVVSVFGDVELQVPGQWDVRFETLAIFGDVRDRRPRDDGPSSEPDLVVTGVTLFGSVVVRD